MDGHNNRNRNLVQGILFTPFIRGEEEGELSFIIFFKGLELRGFPSSTYHKNRIYTLVKIGLQRSDYE